MWFRTSQVIHRIQIGEWEERLQWGRATATASVGAKVTGCERTNDGRKKRMVVPCRPNDACCYVFT